MLGGLQWEGMPHRCGSPATHHRNKVIYSLLLLSDPLLRPLQRNNSRKFTPKAKDFVTLSSTASGGKLGEWKLRLSRAFYPISIERGRQIPAFIAHPELRRPLLSGITIYQKRWCLTRRKSRSNQVGTFRDATIGKTQSVVSSETIRQSGMTKIGG